MTCASWRNFNPWRWLALAIVLLGVTVRLHHLGGDSFWVDEIATVETSRTFSSALSGERDHPPLTYLLTHIALKVWGETEFTARLPALWAGILALPVQALLGRRLFRPETGLWAAFLLALAPFHLKYAQEARHYALLLFFTLLTFLFLHRALTRPGWKPWLLFAAVTLFNLYTHYGALLVLGAQAILISGWSLLAIRQGQWRHLRYPAAVGMLAFLFFLPQLPRLWAALPHNVGAETITDTGRAASLIEWGRNLGLAFGGGSPFLSLLFPLLALAGLLYLAGKRQWFTLTFLLTGLLVPVLLLPLFGIARGPFPRYLITLLPFYLLAASIALGAAIRPVARRSRPAAVAASSFLAVAFFLISLPRLQNEYRFMVGDWRGIADQLAQQPDRPVLALSLNFPNGYNIAAASLPYYLSSDQLLLVGGGGLIPATIAQLADVTGMGLVVHDWNPGNPLVQAGLPIETYPTGLFVTEPVGPFLPTAIALIQTLIPEADTPVPQCLLQQDLAALQAAAGEFAVAAESFAAALAQCPTLPPAAPNTRPAVRQAIVAGLATVLTENNTRQTAALLASLDPHHPQALAALTAVDLEAKLADGAGTILTQNTTEPVRFETFTMPGGEPVPVLLTHPPAQISYSLDLPAEPVTLYFQTALAPQSWTWGGDGARFQVQVQPAGHAPITLYDRLITNDPADRTWHPGRISLADYAGQTVQLILTTTPGPAGDLTGDWAGWAGLRLLWETGE